jgi:hypothetical protein
MYTSTNQMSQDIEYTKLGFSLVISEISDCFGIEEVP